MRKLQLFKNGFNIKNDGKPFKVKIINCYAHHQLLVGVYLLLAVFILWTLHKDIVPVKEALYLLLFIFVIINQSITWLKIHKIEGKLD